MIADAPRQLAQQAARLIKNLPDATRESLICAMEREDATPGSVTASVANPATVEEVRRLLSKAAFLEKSTRLGQVALMLRAAQQLDELHRDGECIDVVWTGPSAPQSALFRSEQTLLDLIRKAQRNVLIVTYLAYKVAEIRGALLDALNRGVRVMLVIEPEKSDGGGASVDTVEELRAHGDGRIDVYAWPIDKRPTNSDGARGILHVKCAVADDDVLLVSSANLTGYSLELNMELGLLVTHGDAPRRVKEHFDKLVLRGVLERVITPLRK
jgi:phosphatidylserine/phosphatidylglycerophosphate/cardiolipin synthase-like enzyme